MFKLTRRADYATRLLLELALADDQKLTAQEAAKRCGVHLPFLRKSIADLVVAGLVATQPGPNGGVSLTRPAYKITMLDVIEATEGSVCINACLVRPGECARDRVCPAHTFWGRLQLLVMIELRAATLDGLVREYQALRTDPRPKGKSIFELIAIPSPRPAFDPGISSSPPQGGGI